MYILYIWTYIYIYMYIRNWDGPSTLAATWKEFPCPQGRESDMNFPKTVPECSTWMFHLSRVLSSNQKISCIDTKALSQWLLSFPRVPICWAREPTGIDMNSMVVAVMTPRQSNGLMSRWFHIYIYMNIYMYVHHLINGVPNFDPYPNEGGAFYVSKLWSHLWFRSNSHCRPQPTCASQLLLHNHAYYLL